MITVVCVLTFCVIPLSVFGQSEPELKEGDRVRVSYGGDRDIYLFQGFENEILIFRDTDSDEIIRLHADQIRRLRVSQGPGPRSSGAGFLGGAGLGLLIGAASGAIYGYAQGDDEPGFLTMTAEGKAQFYGLGFGILGGLTGGIIGAIRSGERWERVDLNIAPANNNTAATFTYSYRF